MLIQIFALTCVIIWLCFSLVGLKVVLPLFKKLQTNKLYDQPRFQGIERKDYRKWNKKKIMVGIFTIFPIKAFFFLHVTMAMNLGSRINNFFNTSWSYKLLYFSFKYSEIIIRCTIANIQEQFQTQPIKTPIIITNHSSLMDIYYLLTFHCFISFVSKAQVRKVLLIGAVAKQIGSIFVERQSQESRSSSADKINQRVIDYKNNLPRAHPLVIFPEGTTSNNKVILRFKNGAFANLVPITIFSFNYSSEAFSIGEDEIGGAANIVLFLSVFATMKVKRKVVEAKDGETPDQYMDRCRQQLIKMGGFNDSDVGFREKKQLESLRKEERSSNKNPQKYHKN